MYDLKQFTSFYCLYMFALYLIYSMEQNQQAALINCVVQRAANKSWYNMSLLKLQENKIVNSNSRIFKNNFKNQQTFLHLNNYLLLNLGKISFYISLTVLFCCFPLYISCSRVTEFRDLCSNIFVVLSFCNSAIGPLVFVLIYVCVYIYTH